MRKCLLAVLACACMLASASTARACEGGDERYPMTCGGQPVASSAFFGNLWFGGAFGRGLVRDIDAGHAGMAALVQRFAVTMGVNPRLALAIARRESGFNPKARGRAGEYGLFQLKCPTARGLGFAGTCAELLDPATNAYWGLKHLAAAQARGGDFCQIATRHNAGLHTRLRCNRYGRAVARAAWLDGK